MNQEFLASMEWQMLKNTQTMKSIIERTKRLSEKMKEQIESVRALTREVRKVSTELELKESNGTYQIINQCVPGTQKGS